MFGRHGNLAIARFPPSSVSRVSVGFVLCALFLLINQLVFILQRVLQGKVIIFNHLVTVLTRVAFVRLSYVFMAVPFVSVCPLFSLTLIQT